MTEEKDKPPMQDFIQLRCHNCGSLKYNFLFLYKGNAVIQCRECGLLSQLDGEDNVQVIKLDIK